MGMTNEGHKVIGGCESLFGFRYLLDIAKPSRLGDFSMNEEDVRHIMQIDWVATASDGSAQIPGADKRQTVQALFPQLRDVRVVRFWAGIEGVLPDEIPVIGPSATQEGAWHAFGFSAHGFQLGPIVGRILAERIVDGHSDLPIAAFRIDRFNQGPAA